MSRWLNYNHDLILFVAVYGILGYLILMEYAGGI